MFTGADVFCRMPTSNWRKRKILIFPIDSRIHNHLPDIEFDIELGMLTGCDEFCSKPVEANPADIEFSKWLKSRLAKSSKLVAAEKASYVVNSGFHIRHLANLQYLLMEPMKVIHIRFRCSFSRGPIVGSFSICSNWNEKM